MKDLITTLDKIIEELKDIQDYLEIEMGEDVEEAVDRGNRVSVYMARSGKLLADAKYHRDKKLRSDIVNEIKEIVKLPASSANKFIDTFVEKESFVINWADRINRSSTHQLEWCRTVISKAKAEMSAFNYNTKM